MPDAAAGRRRPGFRTWRRRVPRSFYAEQTHRPLGNRPQQVKQIGSERPQSSRWKTTCISTLLLWEAVNTDAELPVTMAMIFKNWWRW